MNRRQFICSAVANVVAIRTLPAWASQLEMTVYKDPNCGCCKAWAQAMQNADFAVTIRDMDDLSSIKTKYGVPAAMQGCHTAVVGPYFVEGHVPLEAVEKLLKDAPDIAGLAVPGMPAGSLGMGDNPNAKYDVYAVGKTGSNSVYLQVLPKA
ncbi:MULTISPECIES: DUF411 domain-containing protein [Rhizobium/Agrobacterium group]|uniref:DUF411 domain-containing protein n=1 Tax=Rhizobium/Agrobacterium group TaxID=227290 RepID=UPI00157329B0|nr:MULTISPECIES: DUF411 domain-containing protein [Rhizobium]NTF31925.1 DUF411 domain-containing protein [Rhizobium skierniewicense]